jgi:hypothetical protein
MKKIILFSAIFLYADISNILLKISNMENYKIKFKKIYFTKCTETKKFIPLNNKFELKLMAVFNKKALINNEWLKKGDIIKGYKVIEIYPKKVVLKRENHFIILKFSDLLKVKK